MSLYKRTFEAIVIWRIDIYVCTVWVAFCCSIDTTDFSSFSRPEWFVLKLMLWQFSIASIGFLTLLLCCCSDEKAFLMGKCIAILQRFYDSKSHQKKNVQVGGSAA